MAKELRADAKGNRQQLLDAAAATFLEHGIAVSLDVVIERAKVGRATFYRNFPDRAALIVALLDVAQTRVEEAADRLPDDQHKVFGLFKYIGSALNENPVLVDAWRVLGTDAPEIKKFQVRFLEVFRVPVDIALSAQTLRPDFTLDDVSVVVGMLSAVIREQRSSARSKMVRRVLELIASGVSGSSGETEASHIQPNSYATSS